MLATINSLSLQSPLYINWWIKLLTTLFTDIIQAIYHLVQWLTDLNTGCSRKNCTKFMHHNFAAVRHRVMRFSAKCAERNSLHDKSQGLNTAIKYSLFCSWQVKYLKTKLTEKSLRQICDVNKVRCSACGPRERITDARTLINKRFSTVKSDICIIVLFTGR